MTKPGLSHLCVVFAFVIGGWGGVLAGCASFRFEGAAALRIDCDVPTAQVFIDDAYVGQAQEWSVDGRLVKAGFHRLELRYPDRYTHYEELDLAKGDAVRVQATLRPLLEWM